MEATETIPTPVLTEAKRLLDFYETCDDAAAVTHFEIARDVNDPLLWIISADLIDEDGDEHDEFQVFDPAGVLLHGFADGVRT
jgi:hypothetical protein